MNFVTGAFEEKEANVIAVRNDCPESFLEASLMVEPFDVEEHRNFLENARIFDKGEAGLDKLKGVVDSALNSGKLPLILAERHVASLEAVKAIPKGTKLVVFDAHADMKDEYSEGNYKPVDERTNYATWLRRAAEIVNPKDICLLGVRSCDEEELEFMKESGMLFFTSGQIRDDMENVKKSVSNFIGKSNAYLSLDMDVFDPSIAPAVENPEPNGISYKDFVAIVGPFSKSVVGLDCVEIRPIGENRITEFLAVKVIFKILSLIFS